MENFVRKDAGLTALIVEADQENCGLLEKAAASHGYATLTCNTAAAALAILSETPPQLIVMDSLLADMPGLELLKIIRASAQGKYQTVLLLLAKDNCEDLAAAMAAGADYFLRKPFEEKLLEALLIAATRQVGLCKQKAQDDRALMKIRE